ERDDLEQLDGQGLDELRGISGLPQPPFDAVAQPRPLVQVETACARELLDAAKDGSVRLSQPLRRFLRRSLDTGRGESPDQIGDDRIGERVDFLGLEPVTEHEDSRGRVADYGTRRRAPRRAYFHS